MTIEEMILEARAKGCSDIHLSEGMPVFYRIDGTLAEAGLPLGEKEIRSMRSSKKRLASGQDVDFAIQTPDGCRQRVNVFRQQKKLAATIRLLNDRIPSLGELKLPNILQELASQPRGLAT